MFFFVPRGKLLALYMDLVNNGKDKCWSNQVVFKNIIKAKSIIYCKMEDPSSSSLGNNFKN
jgi:hypothetical protein